MAKLTHNLLTYPQLWKTCDIRACCHLLLSKPFGHTQIREVGQKKKTRCKRRLCSWWWSWTRNTAVPPPLPSSKINTKCLTSRMTVRCTQSVNEGGNKALPFSTPSLTEGIEGGSKQHHANLKKKIGIKSISTLTSTCIILEPEQSKQRRLTPQRVN